MSSIPNHPFQGPHKWGEEEHALPCVRTTDYKLLVPTRAKSIDCVSFNPATTVILPYPAWLESCLHFNQAVLPCQRYHYLDEPLTGPDDQSNLEDPSNEHDRLHVQLQLRCTGPERRIV